MEIRFSDLHKYYFTISNLYAERQFGKSYVLFNMEKPRPTDALLLFTESSAICHQEGYEPFSVPQGSLVYIPKGCTYTWETFSGDDKPTKKMLFEFILNLTDIQKGYKNELSVSEKKGEHISFGKDKIYIVDDNLSICKKLFSSLIDSYKLSHLSPFGTFNAAYNIFEYLASLSDKEKDAKENQLVTKASKYLADFENEKTVEEIANLCFVSVSLLEKQFKKITGLSPLEYKLELKLAQAKMLLVETEMNLNEIAEKTNFSDTAYFCRIFKKKTKMTPKEYRQAKK